MKPPAFPLYADDFLGGTMNFTDAEVGIYMRLLCVQWNTGSIPDDDSELNSYGKAEPSTPLGRVKAKFEKGDDGKLRNARMEAVRSKQTAFREERSKSGTKGAENRWLSHSSAIKQPLAKNGFPSPSPSPVSLERARARATPFPEVGRPTLREVLAKASMIGLAPWKAEDWFNEMQGCGWLDHAHRSVLDWSAVLTRVKVKWESDGRPMSPPKSREATVIDKKKNPLHGCAP